jgi:acyl-CoA thioesterase FadM
MEEPQVPPSGDIRFRCRLATRWVDEDVHGVLNNAVFLTLLEEARYAYFANLGLLDGNRFPFLLRQTNVRFVHPGSGGRSVEVELATTSLGRRSLAQAYRISDPKQAVVWCEAQAVLVVYDGYEKRSVAMSAAFRAAIEAYEGRSLSGGAA